MLLEQQVTNPVAAQRALMDGATTVAAEEALAADIVVSAALVIAQEGVVAVGAAW